MPPLSIGCATARSGRRDGKKIPLSYSGVRLTKQLANKRLIENVVTVFYASDGQHYSWVKIFSFTKRENKMWEYKVERSITMYRTLYLSYKDFCQIILRFKLNLFLWFVCKAQEFYRGKKENPKTGNKNRKEPEMRSRKL